MAKSMTGFGRAVSENDNINFTVEMKSVNHRYLDLNIKMPRNMLALEDRIRKIVQNKLNRGKVDIFITQKSYGTADAVASFNKSLADSYYNCLQKIKENYMVDDDISVSLIAKFPDVVTIEREEEDIEVVWKALQIPLSEAVDMLFDMREKEGKKLIEDIILKIDHIKVLVDRINEKTPLVVQMYSAKLKDRIAELTSDIEIDENRIAVEVAILADKSCIDEEIVRLNSHINQFKDTLFLENPIGRKLDFILQEMNREANTIASKANDIDIVHLVLDIKNEIEKVREQIQNIE
ncbi:MAG: YicC/YloC family endoribonuclease [Bacillota bacterium]|nr:YicC/YloC family endoribonuclease [Bacillota bacterium]